MALDTNLESYWKLDEASGALADSVGGHSGSGTGISYGATGVINDAISLDGVNDSVEIASESSFDQDRTDPFSFQAWAAPSDESATRVIASKYRRDGSNNVTGWALYALDVSAETKWTPLLIVEQGTASVKRVRIEVDAHFAYGSYQHIVVTNDGTGDASGFKIYVGGSEQAVTVGQDNLDGSILHSNPVLFGARNDNGSLALLYSGSLDETAYWKKTLTLTEVGNLYNGGAGLAYPFPAGGEDSSITNAKALALGIY